MIEFNKIQCMSLSLSFSLSLFAHSKICSLQITFFYGFANFIFDPCLDAVALVTNSGAELNLQTSKVAIQSIHSQGFNLRKRMPKFYKGYLNIRKMKAEVR